jgi:hypothetical protein
MTFERRLAQLFRMDDEAWARHANPWSVWTRVISLPLLMLAVWSRIWIGWWSLLPIAGVILWLWINPRAFPPPRSTDNWASKGVLGKRVWLNRRQVPVPAHHRLMPNILSTFSAAGAVIFIWGLVRLEFWPALSGLVLVMLCKLWFLDRMVWLYEDMKDRHPPYRDWLT